MIEILRSAAMRYWVLPATLLMVSFVFAGDKPAVRRIDLKDVKLKYAGKEPQNSVIASAEGLSKSKLFADDASRAVVKKQVDFAKEKLVVSAWRASDGGRLTTEMERGEILTVTFVYQAGEGVGVKEYGAVFIVPKTAKVQSAVDIE